MAVEAQAAGKPVVAYGRGGARETVVHGVSGVLFEEQTLECVVDAIAACELLDTAPEQLAVSAGRFSVAAFAEGLMHVLEATRPQYFGRRAALPIGTE